MLSGQTHACADARREGRRSAFTLVELLVVIGIIAVLIAMLMPALTRARAQAMVTQCASNLKNLGNAVAMYAGEHKGRLPSHPAPDGRWIWDVPMGTRDALVAAGASRSVLYCPSFPEADTDRLWNHAPDYSVIGYFWLVRRPDPLHGVMPQQLAATNYVERYKVPNPWPLMPTAMIAKMPKNTSEYVLASDPIAKHETPTGQVPVWFVKGGWPEPHVTPHLAKNSQPTGGNAVYLDGHVEFRRYNGTTGSGNVILKRCTLPVPGGLPQVEFWW